MFNLVTLLLIIIIIIVLVSLSLATNTKIFSISSSSTVYTSLQASAFIGMTSAAAAAATTTTGGYSLLIFTDPILGIKIEYPAGWTQELEGAGLVTFIANLESGDLNTYPAAVGIKVQNL